MGFAKSLKVLIIVSLLVLAFFLNTTELLAANSAPVMVMNLSGTINPATDDFLKSALKQAKERQARLLVIKLNTPGGLLPSMKSMVEQLLSAEVPTVVFVYPQGASATSAGVFITLAGNFAVMAPGTTIGAAHPVMGSGQDLQGDMREKIENFAVSLARAIAEQRGRNVKWAEESVRESISITDREAQTEKVIDFTASDLETLLASLEGRTTNVNGNPVTLSGLKDAPREEISMNLRQQVANFLSDPNVAILLGLGAMIGLGIELYTPGAVLPGIVGLICLVLSLIAGQVIPINQGGLALLILGAVFFAVELFMPAFGVWGVSGIICVLIGSIYFVDTEQVWSAAGFTVNKFMVGTAASVMGVLMLVVGTLLYKTNRSRVSTGKEGLVGKIGVVASEFKTNAAYSTPIGKVRVMGEIWNARMAEGESGFLAVDEQVIVQEVGDGMRLSVRRHS